MIDPAAVEVRAADRPLRCRFVPFPPVDVLPGHGDAARAAVRAGQAGNEPEIDAGAVQVRPRDCPTACPVDVASGERDTAATPRNEPRIDTAPVSIRTTDR